MVSVAVCGEMEPNPRFEEKMESEWEPKAIEVPYRRLQEDGPTEPSPDPKEELGQTGEGEVKSCRLSEDNETNPPSDPPEPEGGGTERHNERRLRKTNSWKTVRFQDPSAAPAVLQRDKSVESLFEDHLMEEWTCTFEELFHAEDWVNITDDRLLRKKVLEPGPTEAPCPVRGQEVTVKMQCVLEDLTVVEKDSKLEFVIGEGDVNQALEECVTSMKKGEVTLLLADSTYAYGRLGRAPDILPWTPLLYQLQLLDVRAKADPLTLPIQERIRIGNQKRERGNFYFQREELDMAVRAYSMALDILTTHTAGNGGGELKVEEEEEEEVNGYRVKCLNNLATAQHKLGQSGEALRTSRDVLTLQPNNVRALFRMGKLLSDQGEYKEAMDILKTALKLEPTTKAIHAELSFIVRKITGKKAIRRYNSKPERMLGEAVTPFLIPPKKPPPVSGTSWTILLGALVVALGSLVTSVILTARN